MAWTRILVMSVLWHWPWRYNLYPRSWHTLGPWTAIVWNIIQIQHGSEKLPGYRFLVCVRFDLDHITYTLGHGTPLDNGHQLCETSRSNMAERSCRDGWWLCAHIDLDLRGMTLVQGHYTPLDHEQQLCKIFRSDKGVRSDGPDTMWNDGQTGWFLYAFFPFSS